MTARVPRVALVVLAVGLALHNLAMALLWEAGVRDTALDLAAAWKEALLVVAFVAAVAAAGSVPRLLWVDRLALAYGALVVLYWLLPQSWLAGDATARGELYALRHHLLPLGAYVLGRLVTFDRVWWRRIALTIVGVGCALAVWGLVDVYLVPLDWWRDSGVPDWFSEQLGLAYRCLSGLPENWILNTDEESPVRRLVSTFLSPLATAYMLVVACLLLAAARPRRWTVAAGAVVYAGLLWTHTRAAFIALPVGLLVLAALRRSWPLAGLAGGSVVVSVLFVALFPTIGPATTYTAAELQCLRANAAVREGKHCLPHQSLLVRESNVVELDLAEAEVYGLPRQVDRVLPDLTVVRIEPGLAVLVEPRFGWIVTALDRPVEPRLSEQRILRDDDPRDRVDPVHAHGVEHSPDTTVRHGHRRVRRDLAREMGEESETGTIVVGERGMADVRRKQDLVLALALVKELAVGEMAGRER